MTDSLDVPEFVPRLRAESLRHLRRLATDCATAPDLQAAVAILGAGLRAVFGTHAVVLDRLALPASAGRAGADAPDPDVQVNGTTRLDLALGSFGGRTLTIRLADGWSRPRDRAALQRVGAQLSLALQAPAARSEAARSQALVASAYGFARRLAQARFPADLRHLIVDTIAGAVSAEQGSLATYEESEGLLRIAATRGYPSVLVEHLRIVPGRGLLGQVFETRRPMLVDDVHGAAEPHAAAAVSYARRSWRCRCWPRAR